MATPKITREVVATTTQEQSTATFNGWKLNFTTSKDGDTVKSVNVYGEKNGTNVSASVSGNGYVNIGFSTGGRDNALMTALLDELATIATVTAPTE